MSRQSLLWLVLGLVFIQAVVTRCQANISEDEVDGIISDIFDKVKEALKDLLKKVEEAAMKALQDILSNKLQPAIDEIRKNAIVQVKEGVNSYKADITLIQTKAEDLKVDIISCTKAGAAKVKKLSMDSNTKLNKCLSDKLLQLAEVTKGAQQEIENIKAATEAMKHASDTCGSGLLAIPCYTQLLADLLKASVEFPVKISKEAITVLDFLNKLHPEVKQCGENILDDFQTRMSPMVPSVQKCFELIIQINNSSRSKTLK